MVLFLHIYFLIAGNGWLRAFAQDEGFRGHHLAVQGLWMFHFWGVEVNSNQFWRFIFRDIYVNQYDT